MGQSLLSWLKCRRGLFLTLEMGAKWETINHQLSPNTLFPKPVFCWPFLYLHLREELQSGSCPVIFQFYRAVCLGIHFDIWYFHQRFSNETLMLLTIVYYRKSEDVCGAGSNGTYRFHPQETPGHSSGEIKTVSWPKRKLTFPLFHSFSLCSLLSAYASKLNFAFILPQPTLFYPRKSLLWEQMDKHPNTPIPGEGGGALSVGGTELACSKQLWDLSCFPRAC